MFFKKFLLIFLLLSCFINLIQSQALFHHSNIILDDPNVFKLAEDKNGHIWACTNNGLFLIQSNEIKKFNTINGTNSDKFYCIYIDERNRKWIGTDNGVLLIDSAENNIYNYIISDAVSIKEIIFYNNHLFLFTGKNYFIVYDIINKKNKYLKKCSINNNVNFTNKLKYYNNKIFFASENEIYVFESENFYSIKKRSLINDVLCFKNKLVFTSDKYLFFEDEKLDSFKLNIDQPIYRIYEFNQYIFILTLGNNLISKSKIYIFNTEKNELKLLLSIPNLTDLCITKNNDVFVSTLGDGVIKYNFSNLYQYQFTHEKYVVDFYKGDEFVLVGTNKNLICYNTYSNKINRLIINDINSIEYIRKILKYNEHEFFVAFSSYSTFKHKYLKYKKLKFHLFNAKNIYIIDTLLFVNHYNGILELYNIKSEKIIDTIKLSSNYLKVYNFYHKDTLLYISSNNGLYEYNLNTFRFKLIFNNPVTSYSWFNNFRIFTTNNYIVLTDINNNFLTLSAINFYNNLKNYLILNTEFGILLYNFNNVYFLDKKLKIRYFRAPFHITNLKVSCDTIYFFTNNGLYVENFNKLFFYNYKYNFNLIHFDSNRNINSNFLQSYSSRFNFIIESSNNYNNIPIYFRYKIDNNEWNLLKDNYISFRLYDSKNHILYIQYSLNGLTWNHAYSLNVLHLKYFFDTFFFYCLIFIGSTLLVFYLVRFYYMKKVITLNNKIKLLQEVEKLKYQNFTHAINIHFIMNTLNSLQYFIANNKTHYSIDIIGFFGRYLHQSIDVADKTYSSLHEEINRTHYYLKIQQIKHQFNFTYDILIYPSINVNLILCPTLIIQPFVENSIIHGFKNINYSGYLLLKIFKVYQFVFIQIIDNGVGISSSDSTISTNNRKSIGISYTIERMKLFLGKRFFNFSVKPLSLSFGVIVTIIYQQEE